MRAVHPISLWSSLRVQMGRAYRTPLIFSIAPGLKSWVRIWVEALPLWFGSKNPSEIYKKYNSSVKIVTMNFNSTKVGIQVYNMNCGCINEVFLSNHDCILI